MADTALVEETEKRLRSHTGVHGFMVMNGEGIAIRSSLDKGETVHYAALVSRCALTAQLLCMPRYHCELYEITHCARRLDAARTHAVALATSTAMATVPLCPKRCCSRLAKAALNMLACHHIGCRYVEKSRTCIKKLDGDDELDFVRIRSAKHEIMIAPDFLSGTDYYLVVVQQPSTATS